MANGKSSRFVVQEHRIRGNSHYDLMIKDPDGAGLWTWRLDLPPERGRRCAARRIGDHHDRYLWYEGPVSGERGEVRIWDGGPCAVERAGESELVVEICGRRISGRLAMNRLEGDEWELQLGDV